MKIGLVGTHCSGKTTLAKELARLLPDSVVHGSVARTAPPPMEINKEAAVEHEIWIMATRIQREIELSLKRPAWLICERTSLDDFTYLKWQHDRQEAIPNSNLVNIGKRTYDYDEYYEYYNMARSMCKHWMTTYDHLFFLSPLSLEDDGVRLMDEKYQKEIDVILRDRIMGLSVPAHYLVGQTVEEKLREIEPVIKTRLFV